jgi:hypothetical protein
VRPAAVVAAGICLLACSNVDLGAAKTLGETGGASFDGFATSYATTSQQMSRYQESLILRGALAPVPAGTPASATALHVDRQLVDAVVSEMSARARAMKAFVQAYKALEDLAAYDAQGEMQTALTKLGDSVSGFAAAVGTPLASPAAKVATTLVASLGGIIANEAQKNRVKAASVAIRANLEDFAAVHKAAQEKKALVQTRRALFNAQADIVSGLWRKGVLTANKYVADWATGFDLAVVDEKTQPITAKTYPGLATPIDRALRERRISQRAAIEAAYDKTDEVVEGLIDDHKKLEAGIPMDAAAMRARVAALNTLFVQLNSAITAK